MRFGRLSLHKSAKWLIVANVANLALSWAERSLVVTAMSRATRVIWIRVKPTFLQGGSFAELVEFRETSRIASSLSE